MVFQTLNRLKWTGMLERCSVLFVHRGAPGDRKAISGRQITEIKRSYLHYKDGRGETFIPLHRVVEIKMDGETVWKRRTRSG